MWLIRQSSLTRFFLVASVIAASAVAWGTQVWGGEVYRWVNEDGVVQFSDTEPANGDVKALAIQDDETAEVNSTTNTNTDGQQQLVDRHRVVMYSATWCLVCKKAKNGLPSRESNIGNTISKTAQKVGVITKN